MPEKEWLALDDEDQDDQSKAEHLARYEYMKDLVAEKGVLDIGCGAGYGAEEMGTVAAYVIGVDRRPEAIEYARAHHSRPNVIFLKARFQDLRIDDVRAPEPLSVITAFEVLEHLETPSDLLAFANRLLTEEGTFVFSTPYYTRTVHVAPEEAMATFDNPWHLHAWDARGLEELLRPYFADVRIGVQHRFEFLEGTARPGTSWFVTCRERIP